MDSDMRPGRRWATTFRKDPMMRPKAAANGRATGIDTSSVSWKSQAMRSPHVSATSALGLKRVHLGADAQFGGSSRQVFWTRPVVPNVASELNAVST